MTELFVVGQCGCRAERRLLSFKVWAQNSAQKILGGLEGLTSHGVASDNEWPARVLLGSCLQGCCSVAVHKGGGCHHSLMHLACTTVATEFKYRDARNSLFLATTILKVRGIVFPWQRY